MPWTTADVERHMKDLSPSEKETWVEVANKALAACEKAGRKDCDASAIKQANSVVGKIREALSADEEIFVEAATFKALIQGLMRQARGVANHKSVPKAIKSKLADLGNLLQKTYKTMAGEGDAASDAAAEASGDTSDAAEDFKEEGTLLEVDDG